MERPPLTYYDLVMKQSRNGFPKYYTDVSPLKATLKNLQGTVSGVYNIPSLFLLYKFYNTHCRHLTV